MSKTHNSVYKQLTSFATISTFNKQTLQRQNSSITCTYNCSNIQYNSVVKMTIIVLNTLAKLNTLGDHIRVRVWFNASLCAQLNEDKTNIDDVTNIDFRKFQAKKLK
ncbi:Hypothetical_protein [Hexamita inflata]|uniref:Hypothetical_protein n=1 Tax=Hexamita inflata TaxID=28002 RepID=A0ABP1GHC8_9EUKA